MLSKITGGKTSFLYTATVLNKYEINYYRCDQTGFVQTEEPFWLEEAYSNAITKLDLGLIQRNLQMADLVQRIISRHFDSGDSFLDYAGGYGMFTRLMRDRGFDFYNTDKYCTNLFAEYNDLANTGAGKTFELTTAFEVFEHLAAPITEIAEMMSYSDNLLFSTELIPQDPPKPEDWWYFSLETGQHIAFYTQSALQYIAKKFNKFFYTNGQTVHLFTTKPLASDPFKKNAGTLLALKFFKHMHSLEKRFKGKRNSLLEADMAVVKRMLSDDSSRKK